MDLNSLEMKERIVKLALMQYNKTYVHGAKGPDEFDCAGLAWYIYNRLLGVDIFYKGYGKSTTTKIMTSKVGKLLLIGDHELKELDKGDILLIHRQSLQDDEPKKDNKYPGHCGIYLGDGRFIHATKATYKVSINSLDEDTYWKEKVIGFKKILK